MSEEKVNTVSVDERELDLAWGQAALDDECQRLHRQFKNEPGNPGNRKLFSNAAIKLYSIVHGGSLDETMVRSRLLAIASLSNLSQKNCNQILNWGDDKAGTRKRKPLYFMSHADRKILIMMWFQSAINDPELNSNHRKNIYAIANKASSLGKTSFDMSFFQWGEEYNANPKTIANNFSFIDKYIVVKEKNKLLQGKATKWELILNNKRLMNPLSFCKELTDFKLVQFLSDEYQQELNQNTEEGVTTAPILSCVSGPRPCERNHPPSLAFPTLTTPQIVTGDISLMDPTHNLWAPRFNSRRSEMYRLLAVTGEGFTQYALKKELGTSCKKTVRADVHFLRDYGLIEKRGGHEWYASDKILTEADGVEDHLAKVQADIKEKRKNLKMYLSDSSASKMSAKRRREHAQALKKNPKKSLSPAI